MSETDWLAWHGPYEDPDSPLSRRLTAVQSRLVEALDQAPPGPIAVISLCAGQGRDLVGALTGHPRRQDVRALLVEADRRNAVVAAGLVEAAGLSGIEIVVGDASVTDAYATAVPAQIVVICGVFGNISPADLERTVALLPTLCRPGAAVVWTRHRRPPDRTGAIRDWLAEAGFTEVGFDAPPDLVFGVGSHRLEGPAAPFRPGTSLFDFTGDGSLPA